MASDVGSRISMGDNAEGGSGNMDDLKQQATDKASQATGGEGGQETGEAAGGGADKGADAAGSAMDTAKSSMGGEQEGVGGLGDEGGSIESKMQDAMSKGEAGGLLSSEQLQDGSMQDKVKEAIEKGESGPGDLLNKVMGGLGGGGGGDSGGGGSNPMSNFGNSFGNTIEDKLSPVGNVAGKGFEQIGKPVGGVVDPLVGGTMRTSEAYGGAMGVGSGNMDKKNEREAADKEEMKKDFGGQEQTGDNPLGL